MLFSSWDGSQTVHSWLLRWMCLLGTPQTSDAHLRQACLPSRTHLCSPFWLSSFDHNRHSPQHPSYTNCFSLTLHCQVPMSSLSPNRRDTLSSTIVSSRWDHGLCTLLCSGMGKAGGHTHFPQSKCKHFVHPALRHLHKARDFSKPISFKINWKRRL